MATVLVIALGSIGDALPLLAITLKNSKLGSRYNFIVNSSVKSLLTMYLDNFNRFWKLDTGSTQLLDLDIAVLPASADSSAALEFAALADMVSSLPVPPSEIVMNLWSAAAGYHLADALCIPCRILSPAPAPPSTAAANRAAVNAIAKRDATIRAQLDADLALRTYMEHWAAAIFQDVYRTWRVAKGLPDWPTISRIPVHYCCNPALLPRPGWWPPEIDVTGWWGSLIDCVDIPHTCAAVSEFLSVSLKTRRQQMFVGFGSMNRTSVAPDDVSQRAIVDRLTSELGVCVLWQLSQDPMPALGQCGCCKSNGDNILRIHHAIPHHIIFRCCHVAVHHGGAGISHTAAAAGVSQVIVPMAFDQQFWAERLEFLGVSTTVAVKSAQDWTISMVDAAREAFKRAYACKQSKTGCECALCALKAEFTH
jgi:hypothetical protein